MIHCREGPAVNFLPGEETGGITVHKWVLSWRHLGANKIEWLVGLFWWRALSCSSSLALTQKGLDRECCKPLYSSAAYREMKGSGMEGLMAEG